MKEIIMTNKGRNEHVEPYTLAFMYNRSGKSLLLKGYLSEVNEYIRSMKFTALVNLRFYIQGRSRGYWQLYHKGISVGEVLIKEPRLDHAYRDSDSETKWIRKWKVYNYKLGRELFFKRLPKRWIPEFDMLLNK